MTATALTFPEPLPDDPDAVTTALETAAIFGTQGDTREAVRWIRRAAEAAGDEGNDMRALALARLAADLTSQLGGNNSVAPSVAPSAAAEAAAKAAKASADTLIAVPSPGSNGVGSVGASDPAFAPTVSPRPPAELVAPPSASPALPVSLNGQSVEEPEATVAASPPSLEAVAAPEAAAPAWVPPVPPPPPVLLGFEETASEAAPVADPLADAETDSTRETAPGIGATQPPAQSLRAALQRFSQHVAQGQPQPNSPQPAAPDPSQSPALAALVQSIQQQSPRPSGTPSHATQTAATATATATAAAAAATAARGLSSLPRGPVQAFSARPASETRAAVDAVLNPPLAALEPEPAPLPPPSSPVSADPFSDAITDPRLVPAVEPVAAAAMAVVAPALEFAAPAPVPAPPSLAEALGKKAVSGARLSVRAGIAATTEDGLFLVELLKDGQSPNPGAHEALIVLTDPKSDLFE